jgi:hypothetical protein
VRNNRDALRRLHFHDQHDYDHLRPVRQWLHNGLRAGEPLDSPNTDAAMLRLVLPGRPICRRPLRQPRRNPQRHLPDDYDHDGRAEHDDRNHQHRATAAAPVTTAPAGSWR